MVRWLEPWATGRDNMETQLPPSLRVFSVTDEEGVKQSISPSKLHAPLGRNCHISEDSQQPREPDPAGEETHIAPHLPPLRFHPPCSNTGELGLEDGGQRMEGGGGALDIEHVSSSIKEGLGEQKNGLGPLLLPSPDLKLGWTSGHRRRRALNWM